METSGIKELVMEVLNLKKELIKENRILRDINSVLVAIIDEQDDTIEEFEFEEKADDDFIKEMMEEREKDHEKISDLLQEVEQLKKDLSMEKFNRIVDTLKQSKVDYPFAPLKPYRIWTSDWTPNQVTYTSDSAYITWPEPIQQSNIPILINL